MWVPKVFACRRAGIITLPERLWIEGCRKYCSLLSLCWQYQCNVQKIVSIGFSWVSLYDNVDTAQTAVATWGRWWKFVQLSNSELLWLVPAGMSLLPPCKWSTYLQHLTMNTCWVGESSCLCLTCALSSKLQKYVEVFRVGGGIWDEKWHSSVLGRTSSRLTAGRRGGQMCTLNLSVSQHSCGKVSCRLPAACCDFFCVHLCMYWLCIILQTCLCLPASPKNPQLCLLSHMCWMPFAHQEHRLKVLPIPWTDAKRDSVFTHLELCISSLSLASGLQVVWLMGVDSLGSSCGQCSVLIRGRAVLGGFFTSWCVNFLLHQKMEQSHPTCLPVAVSVARKATGSGGRTGSLLHAAHGHTRLCLTSNCCLTYLLLTLDVPANGNGWASIWLFLGSEFQNAATNNCLALKS